MRPWPAIEAELEAATAAPGGTAEPAARAAGLLALGEEVLEHWLTARGQAPTEARREGFRLLALQRQGAAGEPGFNACRETCRELVYHYNLIASEPAHAETAARLAMMGFVARHLFLFVGGKLEQSALGDFCCSARPLRAESP